MASHGGTATGLGIRGAAGLENAAATSANESSDALQLAKSLLLQSPTLSPPPTTATTNGFDFNPSPRKAYAQSRGTSSASLRSTRDDAWDHPFPHAPTTKPGEGSPGTGTRKRQIPYPSPGSTHAGPSSSSSKRIDERKALAKLVKAYENVSLQLEDSLSKQNELETNLKIARSNLALAENHAEALEDTLKRNSQANRSGSANGSPGVGPGGVRLSTQGSNQGSTGGGSALFYPGSRSPNPNVPSDTEDATSPRLGSFWKRAKPAFAAPSLLAREPDKSSGDDEHVEESDADDSKGSLFKKPSLAMLRLSGPEKTQTAAQLQAQLLQAQQSYASLEEEHASLQEAHAVLNQKYSSLQEEIENLSVSLFEEANQMVADERKVNTFLNQQLDEAKAQVEALERELEELRANQSLAPTVAPKLGSPEHSLRNYQMHRRSTSGSIDAKAARRRTSSVAAIDRLEDIIQQSPRRASIEMAAAAAAVRALARERPPDLPPSYRSGSPAHTMQSVPSGLGRSNLHTPTASSSGLTDHSRQSSLSSLQHSVATTPGPGASVSTAPSSLDTADDVDATPGKSTSRWYAFRNRRAKTESHANIPPPVMERSPDPSESAVSKPPTPKKSPFRNSPNRLKSDESVTSSGKAPKASPDASQPSTSVIPLPNSPVRSRANSRGTRKSSASSIHSKEELQSPPLQRPAIHQRTSSSSSANRDRFFSSAQPRPGHFAQSRTASTQAIKSPGSDVPFPMSPPVPTELNALLDQVAQDTTVPFGVSDPERPVVSPPLPSDAQGQQTRSLRSRKPSNWSLRSTSTNSNAARSPRPDDTFPQSPLLEDAIYEDHGKDLSVPPSTDLPRDSLPFSSVKPRRSPRSVTSDGQMPPFLSDRARASSSQSVRSTRSERSDGAASRSEVATIPSARSRHQLAAIDTSGVPLSALPEHRRPSDDASFSMATPPLFKRFQDSPSFKSPTSNSPSGSMTGISAFLQSANIHRQSSGLSASGSVQEDLDTLLKSIDAINESLGLQDDDNDDTTKNRHS